MRMQSQKQRDTKPERILRSLLHRRGLRFFVDRSPVLGLRRRADVIFPSAKVAVFVDGCFWHGCPVHATWPKANAAWWRNKIETNRRRDADTDARLSREGWVSVRVWEHDVDDEAADRIESVVRRRVASASGHKLASPRVLGERVAQRDSPEN
jgi:DNA mismatch endonuclease (patch repair protein)